MRSKTELRQIAGDATTVKTHIIFLHGLTGGSTKTWTTKTQTGGVLWPSWLSEDVDRSVIWSIGYPAPLTNWFSFLPNFSELCDHLLAILKAEKNLKHGEIYFVAHSLGGLVVKQILVSALRDAAADQRAANLLSRIQGVAFLGTPHRGSFLANMFSVFPVRVSKAIQRLMVGDDQVHSIYSTYKALARNQKLRHLPLVEGRPARVFGLSLPFRVVSTSSADPGVEELPITMPDDDHHSIATPDSRQAHVYTLLLDFLREEQSAPLPPNFERPEWLMGEIGLRARLSSEQQPYVPAHEGPTVSRLRIKLEDFTRPVVIIGDGGLGKTRLALELYLGSGRKGILIQRNAQVSEVIEIIKKAKGKNEKVLFLIDYIEEFQDSYDGIHEAIVRHSNGFASLVVTTRALSLDSVAISLRNSQSKLSKRTCEVVSLNDRDLLPWRRRTCDEILSVAQVPENLRQTFGAMDIPVIATLIAYDFTMHGAQVEDGVRTDDSRWLSRRLRRNIDPSLPDLDFALLLSLYPFDNTVREALPKSLRKAADTLLRNGWASSATSDSGTEWRLGHDLLADIPLTDFLLSENKIDLRCEIIMQLSLRAKELQSSPRFARSLSRALRRLIESTFVIHIYQTLKTCAQALALANSSPELAAEAGLKSLTSLSLSFAERLRVVQKIPGLSEFQSVSLIEVFNEEAIELKKVSSKELLVVQNLSINSALGIESHLRIICDTLDIAIPPIIAPPPDDLIGFFIPSLYSAIINPSGDDDSKSEVDAVDLQLLPMEMKNLANEIIPKHPLPLLAKQAWEGALGSLSLSWKDKNRVLVEMPRLSGFQLKSMIEVFNDEVVEFEKLKETEGVIIGRLIEYQSQNMLEHQSLLENRYGVKVGPHLDNSDIPKEYEPINPNIEDFPSSLELGKLSYKSRYWISKFACDLAEQANSTIPILLEMVVKRFAEDTDESVQLQVVRATLRRALEVEKSLSEAPPVSDQLLEFASADDPMAREYAAGILFDRSLFFAERDNDPEAYNPVIELFAKDPHPPVREQAAKAAFNKVNNLAKRDNDPEAYNPVIELFAKDPHPPVRESAAMAAFNKANRLAKRDNDPEAYNPVIELFAKDPHPPVREQAAMAAFNKANRLAKRDNDPEGYNPVIELFAKDPHPPAREIAAMAAINKANCLAKRDNDPEAYSPMIELFAKDPHPPAREIAARAASAQCGQIANHSMDPDVYTESINRFAEDDHLPVREIVSEMRCARVGYLVVANRTAEAINEGEVLIAGNESPPYSKAVLTFLLWLAKPTTENQVRAEDFAESLQDERATWTFNEFSSVIKALTPSEQNFAQRMISRLEQN